MDEDHLSAAADWLCLAQDVQDDHGVCGRYRLREGWTSSYPETTGYIIPTFLALAKSLSDEKFIERAKLAVEFLLSVQLPNGAFPGGEIRENTDKPSPFNSAQIIHGLVSWYEHSQDVRVLDAAERAGDWLITVQDADGAWRRHFYDDTPATYSAHMSCWLAQLGKCTGENRFSQAAGKNLEWVIGHQDQETGWFDLAGFNHDQHTRRIAYTHTIAYTVWGVLYAGQVLNDRRAVDAAQRAAEAILRRLEISKWLPGILDWRWRECSEFGCLTGNAQMALIWFRLFDQMGDYRFVNAAFEAHDLVKEAQVMRSRNPALRGGVAGSDPIWGEYILLAFPNWSVKYFIDSLLEKRRILGTFGKREPSNWMPGPDVPNQLPSCQLDKGESANKTSNRLKVVMLTRPNSLTVSKMVRAWSDWGFLPDAVVVENIPQPPIIRRVSEYVREKGIRSLLHRAIRKQGATNNSNRIETTDISTNVIEFCRNNAIRIVEVESFNDARSIESLKQLNADLFIQAGVGILRQNVIDIPKLGILNAHMGILPRYRGINVAEWAAFHGDAVGCTVHLIDKGVDTGPILCVRKVDVKEAKSIAELRGLVDAAQVELLGSVLKYICENGELPPSLSQFAQEGRQYYKMHADVAQRLECELSTEQLLVQT